MDLAAINTHTGASIPKNCRSGNIHAPDICHAASAADCNAIRTVIADHAGVNCQQSLVMPDGDSGIIVYRYIFNRGGTPFDDQAIPDGIGDVYTVHGQDTLSTIGDSGC